MTGQRAIELIASMTGIPLVTLGVLVRSLRESGLDLWPQSGRGGGRKAAHVQLRHTASLVLALGQNAVTEAAITATRLGELSAGFRKKADFSTLEFSNLESAKRLDAIVGSGTLMDVLSAIIEWFSEDSVFLPPDDGFTLNFRFQVFKRYDYGYCASFDLTDAKLGIGPDKKWELALFQNAINPDLSVVSDVAQRISQYPAAVTETRGFDYSFFLMLAAIWRDTKVHNSKSSSGPSAPPSAEGPETEDSAPPSAGTTSQSEQFRSDTHPLIYPNALSTTRRDGRSVGRLKARPEGHSLSPNPPSRDDLLHVTSHREYVRA